jgi:4-hydroxybenzoate polyprenyltransferase
VIRVPRPIGDWAEFLHLRAIPVVVGAGFVFVWVAASGRPPRSTGLFLLSLVVTQIAIAFHNNWCDRDLDAATKPWRLIPRGALRAATARWIAWALFVVGLAVVVPVGPLAFVAIAVGTVCGFVTTRASNARSGASFRSASRCRRCRWPRSSSLAAGARRSPWRISSAHRS